MCYDPIINSQDCYRNWLNTLEITSDTENKNAYNIYFVFHDNQKKYIKLSVVNDNGKYLINDILSDINLHNRN